MVLIFETVFCAREDSHPMLYSKIENFIDQLNAMDIFSVFAWFLAANLKDS